MKSKDACTRNDREENLFKKHVFDWLSYHLPYILEFVSCGLFIIAFLLGDLFEGGSVRDGGLKNFIGSSSHSS